MILPSVDYSPLRQAKSQESQAKRSQFIAPQIDYQTESLKLQKKGLERTQSHISEQQNINTLQFMYNTAKTMVEAAFVAGKGAQMAKAQTMGTEMAGAWDTKVAEMVANGQMYVTTSTDYDPTDAEGGVTSAYVVGMDELQKFQDQQLDQIRAQGFMPQVENQAISAMQKIYAGGEQKMLQDYYNKEIRAKNALDQINLSNAMQTDIAASTLESPSYTNTLATISNMNLGPNAATGLIKTSIQDMNLSIAANDVRKVATAQGGSAGVVRANAISDARGYTPEQRQQLIGYATQSGRQAQVSATANGTQFMQKAVDTALANGQTPDFINYWQQINATADSMSNPEAAKSYRAGAETVQLDYLTKRNYELTKNVDDMMPEQLEVAISNAQKADSVYEGTEATKGMQGRLIKTYKDQLKIWTDAGYKAAKEAEKNEKERAAAAEESAARYVSQKTAILGTYLPLLENEQISGNDFMTLVNRDIAEAEALQEAGYISAEQGAKIIRIGTDAINDMSKHLPPSKKAIMNDMKKELTQDMMSWYKAKNEKDLDDAQLQQLHDIQAWYDGAMLDIVMQGRGMTDDQFKELCREKKNLYQIKNADALADDIKITTHTMKEEAAMERTQAFQDMPQMVTQDNKTKELKIVPIYKEAFDNAALIERDMLRENYGIKVKDGYKPMMYGDKMVPTFEADDDTRMKYMVMDDKVYKWYNNGQIVEMPRIKEFTFDGMPDGARHLLGDANAGFTARSKTNEEIKRSWGGR